MAEGRLMIMIMSLSAERKKQQLQVETQTVDLSPRAPMDGIWFKAFEDMQGLFRQDGYVLE